jgi:4-hydroxy-2-oxoheptanedioate aldolase
MPAGRIVSTMTYIRERVLAGELLSGTWCNLASSISTEIAALAGFDWVLIDMEHAPGELSQLLPQLQAVDGTGTTPIVRVQWNDGPLYKRALDLGAAGVMVPYVSTAEEAAEAVKGMLYPPDGMRGVASATRSMAYGRLSEQYLNEANDKLLTIVQIETVQAIENIEAIAKTDHVDVLFIGPMDLSTNFGIQKQYDHPLFRDAVKKVIAAAKNNGKAAGILLKDASQLAGAVEDGYTFIALGSVAGAVAKGTKENSEAFASFR